MSQDAAARVFVSAATGELGKHRRAVRIALERAGCEVEVQERFTAHPGKFLQKLYDYIRECDAVVCLVGNQFGWRPPDSALIRSDSRDSYPEALVSATQWEYFLAADCRRDIFLYLTEAVVETTDASGDTSDQVASQKRFREYLANSGRDCNRFSDADVLARSVADAYQLGARRKGGDKRARVLPRAAQHFTGRVSEINWLKETLQHASRIALIGPGGIGKTAIAHQAIRALSPPDAPFTCFPGGIFFHDFYAAPSHLSAVEDINRQSGFTDLKDHEREPNARAVLSGPRSLVCLEGCEKAESLFSFTELCGPATILVTSRSRNDAKGAVPFYIDPLTEANAAEMLRRHVVAAARSTTDLPRKDEAIWREIATLLGRHALALRLAGFRLGDGNETPSEFRDSLRAEGSEYFDEDDRRKESLRRLFTYSVAALTLPARTAWFVLALHALAPVHLAPIATALGLDDSEAKKVLRELVRQSLAEATRIPSNKEGEEEQAWILSHALLFEWGQKHLEHFGVDTTNAFSRWLEWWNGFIAECLDAHRVQGGPTRYAAVSEHFDALLGGISTRALEDDQKLSSALRRVGIVHHWMGRYAVAEIYYQRCLSISEKTLGPEHPHTLEGLNSLAILLKDRGDLAKAESIYRRVLDIRERTLGPDESATLMSLNNLAVLLYDKGELAKAAPLFQRALEVRERTLGPEHSETLQSVSNLAVLLHDLGDLTKAKKLCLRALELRKKTLGPEHPDTLDTLQNFASLLIRTGDLQTAESLMQRVVTAFGKLLLPQHPGRQKAERLLAQIRADLAKLEE